jgi:SPP1 family predicted phage head-tail adaptor
LRQRDLASRLRHRVDLVRVARVDDAVGGWSTELVVDEAAVAAEVLSLPGSEVTQEGLLQAVRHFRITIRWRDDVPPYRELRYRGELLNIRSIVDPDGRRRELVILADNTSTLGGD